MSISQIRRADLSANWALEGYRLRGNSVADPADLMFHAAIATAFCNAAQNR